MLDIRTVLAMLALSCCVAGIGILGIKVPLARRASTRRWAISNFCVAGGLMLLALRDMIPLWPSVVLGTGFLLSGFLLSYQAICLLVKKKFNAWLQAVLCLSFFLSFHFFVELDLHPRFRIIAASLILAATFSGIALALRHLRGTALGRPRLLLAGLYYFAASAMLVRAVDSAFSASGAASLFAQTPLQILAFTALYLGVVGSSIAYMLMQGGLAWQELDSADSNDMLAGPGTRHHFMQMAERDWALARRLGRPLSVMMVDPEHFGSLEARYNQVTSDEALHRFGEMLRRSVREVDLVCRHAGGEFCVVMSDTAPEVARHGAERIRREFAGLQMQVGDRQLPLSVSIGIAGLRRDDPRTLAQLLGAADFALHVARASGGQVKMESL
jgi:diguanylate cyclase (GGDEF)-like protein